MTPTRRLIVNADDLGRSAGINAGIERAARDGIVTSASLMVRFPLAADAVEMARRIGLDVGLHIDLGEYTYVDGAWVPEYEVVDRDDRDAVAAEVELQVERFHDLVGAPPSHIDSHQHAHRAQPLRSIVLDVAGGFAVPLRDEHPHIRYDGSFYGQDSRGVPYPEAITVEALLARIAGLPPGVTELGCHPGAVADIGGMYIDERVREMEVLCDPRVRRGVDDAAVTLVSFADLART